MAVKISEEALLNDASESLAELTGLDQEWLSAVLRHRKQQFRKLLREDVGSKTVEQGSGKNGSSSLHQVYKTKRAELRKIRIASIKEVLERERKLAKLEESHIDKFIAGLAAPIPSETQEPAPTDRTSNEQEDQILLERLKEVERRAQELAEAQKVKAAKGRTPAVRSALEGLDPCTTPSNSLLQHAASPEELLFLLREAQKH